MIDSYDSFTYNLVHLVKEMGAEVSVLRNDRFSLEELEPFDKIMLSPGPGIPSEAGLLLDTIRAYAGKKPILGICLGTQILFERSEEDGGTACLGLLRGEVRRFVARGPREKIPEMGWNQARIVRPHPLLRGVPDGSDFYFVHSYHPVPADPADVVADTEYCGVRFASMVGRGNLAATQFHPEKSGKTGLRLLANFAAWDGSVP